jgi:hypothetical protein
MAIVVEDRHGRMTRARRAHGAALDRKSARYYSVVKNSWSRGFRTKREAERDEAERKAQFEDGVAVARSNLTLSEFVSTIWKPLAAAKLERGDLKASTFSHYRLNLECHALPTLGDIRLRSLRPAHLRNLYAGLARAGGLHKRGLSPKSIKHVHTILVQVLALAQSDGYVGTKVSSLHARANRSLVRAGWPSRYRRRNETGW